MWNGKLKPFSGLLAGLAVDCLMGGAEETENCLDNLPMVNVSRFFH